MIKKYNQYIKESLLDKFLNDGFDSCIYYTKGASKNEILQVYQILFDNGFSCGSTKNIDDLDGSELNCTLLIINLRTDKIVYSTSQDFYNDRGSINSYLRSVGLRKYFYLFHINISEYQKKGVLNHIYIKIGEI